MPALAPRDINSRRSADVLADALGDAFDDWNQRRVLLGLPDNEPVLLIAISRQEALSIYGILSVVRPAVLPHETVLKEAARGWLDEFEQVHG